MYLNYNMLDNRNLMFLKKDSIVSQFVVLNQRISEWAHFLNLDKRFQRYLCFKKGGFCGQELQGNFILEWHQKQFLMGFFCSSLGINPHNFVKNHSVCKNKDLCKILLSFTGNIFHVAKKQQEVWGLRTNFGLTGAKRLIKP